MHAPWLVCSCIALCVYKRIILAQLRQAPLQIPSQIMAKKMTEILLFIVVAVSLTCPHRAMAANPAEGFGGRTHLVGLDGLCMDSGGRYHYPTQLKPCEKGRDVQLWTILNDGTVRSNDKCLVSFQVGDYVITSDCYKSTEYDKTWILKKDGTLLHVHSGLALTVKAGSFLTLEPNRYAPSQSWDATEDPRPPVVNIMWLSNKCLQSEEVVRRVWLNSCNKETRNQQWALFGDGTIRVDGDRSYCLSSFGPGPDSSVVGVSKCEDKTEQRWNLNLDSNVVNPSTSLVMDVVGISSQLMQTVILNKRNGAPSQRWTILSE